MNSSCKLKHQTTLWVPPRIMIWLIMLQVYLLYSNRIMIYKVMTVSIFLSLVHFSWETLWFKQIQQENSSRWYSSGPSGTEWRREATTGGEISGVTGPECSVSHWCCVRTHGMWFIFYCSSGFFIICFLFNFALFHW